jgi:hypothetical protein
MSSQYGIRIEYAVIDLNYSDREKFPTAKTTSKQIDAYLHQGKKYLKITRDGSDKSTYYNVIPA